MIKFINKNFEVFASMLIGVSVLICMFLYMAIAISWSDADYCAQGISPETTCREHYTLFNWIKR